MSEKLKLKAKVQMIYYSTPDDVLCQAFATPSKPLNFKECEEILEAREIEYKEILKKQYHHINLEMTPKEAEKYLIVH